MNDASQMLDRLVAKAGRLYSLPAVAMKVLDLTKDPQIDSRALKDCIENDPALTGRILGVVNSSLFGLGRDVSDLNQALAILGSKPLKLLVLGFSLPTGLFSGVRDEVLGRYWRHTLTKAVAAREICEAFWHVPGDDAFIAGLLQDVGMLMLIQELQDPYVRFLDRAFATGEDLEVLEARSMGFDHTELSSRLLATWGLPDTLVEAVAWNRSAETQDGAEVRQGALPKILRLAELVARLVAGQRPELLPDLLDLGRRYRDLAEPDVDRIVVTLQEKVGQLAEILSLKLPEGLDYRDVLIEAHARLADVAGETVNTMLATPAEEALGAEEAGLLAELRELSAAGTRRPAPAAETARVPNAVSTEPSLSVAAARRPTGSVWRSQTADPSSNVDPHPDLLGRLAVGAAACRQSRGPLSLLLTRISRNGLKVSQEGDGFGGLQAQLETLCRGVDHHCAICLPHGNAGFALILPLCERHRAVELGSQLIEDFGGAPQGSRTERQRAVSISVGAATVALPPKNFQPESLFAAADRCLYGSRVAGGGVVKSIEI